jgi:hypothetical protein
MSRPPLDRPVFKVIEGDRRSLEEAAVRAIVFDPENLRHYAHRLKRKGNLALIFDFERSDPDAKAR